MAECLKKGRPDFKQCFGLFLDTTFSISVSDVLNCSLKYNISAYDAEYIVLAKSNKTRLVTVDKKLNKAIPQLTRLL